MICGGQLAGEVADKVVFGLVCVCGTFTLAEIRVGQKVVNNVFSEFDVRNYNMIEYPSLQSPSLCML